MTLPGRLPAGDMYPAGEQDVRARFIRTASGIRVRVVEAGSPSAPPVVLVPGWACTAWIYRDTLPALAAAGFRAIAVELKGLGLSDKPSSPAEYTLEAMRDNLVAVLDALSIGAAGLVGHSMGAPIAVEAAILEPDRVTGVALVAPVGFAGVRGMGLFRALTPAVAIPALPYLASRFVVRTMLRVAYGDRHRPTDRDVDELRAPTQFPEYTRALRHLLHSFDWEVPFPRLEVPHMVIAGSKDHLSPARDADRYAGDHPVLVVEGAGHVLFSESPEPVNSALISFFRSPRRPGYISSQNE